MEIQINGQPINFELESEKSIRDIVNFIAKWISERNLVFYSIQIDNEDYLVDEVPEADAGKTGVINCIVKSKADVVFSTIDEGAAYCKRVLDFIQELRDGKKINQGEIQNLRTGIDWLAEVLVKAMHIIGLQETTRYRDRVIADYLGEMKNFSTSLREMSGENITQALADQMEFFFDIQNILKMLLLSDEMKNLIVQSIESPDALLRSLKSIRDELSDELANVEEAAIAFQKGKDREGTEKLNRFIDFIYGYTRTCYQTAPVFSVDLSAVTIGSESLEEKNRNIRDLLVLISETLENNDMVTLSDILEYELSPCLKDLDLYIDSLQTAITAKKS